MAAPATKKKWKANSNKKWAPPQPHEHGKRNINGAAMWYNKHNRHWVPDKDANTSAANLAGAKQQQPVVEQQATVPTPPAAAVDNVNMANQLKTLQATFASFQQQMLLADPP
jgi:hypothetical protein